MANLAAISIKELFFQFTNERKRSVKASLISQGGVLDFGGWRVHPPSSRVDYVKNVRNHEAYRVTNADFFKGVPDYFKGGEWLPAPLGKFTNGLGVQEEIM